MKLYLQLQSLRNDLAYFTDNPPEYIVDSGGRSLSPEFQNTLQIIAQKLQYIESQVQRAGL